MPPPTDAEHFPLGDVVLQHGMTLPDARLAYQTYGTLNADRSNAIVYPTWYSGLAHRQRVADRPGQGARPGRVVHHRPEHARQRAVDVSQQHPAALRPCRFPPSPSTTRSRRSTGSSPSSSGIETLALVLGWSMGAGQTYQWAVSHPEMVQRAVAVLRFVPDQRRTTRSSSSRSGPRCAPTPPSPRAGTRRRACPRAGCARSPASTPAGDSRRRSTGSEEWRRPGLLLARGLPRRVLGGLLARRARPEQPAGHARGPGSTATSGRLPASTGTPSRR